MKKVLALVMCAAMILCVGMTAMAATQKTASFTVTTVTDKYNVGDVALVDLVANEENTGIGAFAVKFSYDTEYLKFVENPEEGDYFITGKGAGGATAVGNEETMELQMATANGFKKADVVVTLAFEVIKDIPEGKTAVVSVEEIPGVVANADDPEGVEYTLSFENGGVAHEKTPTPPEPPVSSVPSEGGNGGGTTTTATTTNPKTGDASAVAVAAGLCAVMAAAFVITKKVHD